MAGKLYYGDGNCTIEGTEIRGVQIRYRGAIEITKTCGDNAILMEKNNGIIIFIFGEGYLNDLFSYVGDFKVISVIVAGKNGENVSTSIKRVMDYSELMDSKAEDLTTKSEDLSAGYVHKRKVTRTTVNEKYLKNQHTDGQYFFKDGTSYSGAYHIHLDSLKAMTGGEHSDKSVDLYIKQKDKIMKTGIDVKKRATRTTRTTRRTSGGTGGGGY